MKSTGQSTLEFVLILAALTFLGAYIAVKMWPNNTGGALMNVQNNAANKIGND